MIKSRVTKVVVPVAGLGTRGLPFTKAVPKELLPIIDTPTIQFIVEEVISAGVDQVIFITSKGKSALEDYFDPSPQLEDWLRKKGKAELADKLRDVAKLCEVISVRQKEPLGLGHAILCARHIIKDERFAVCLGDEIFPDWDAKQEKPVLKSLIDAAVEYDTSVVGVVKIPKEETRSYGIIDTGGTAPGDRPVKIHRTVEKPSPEAAPSHFAIIGRYVFEPILLDQLKEIKPGMGGEIQLTDAMDRLAGLGRLHAVLATGLRYDIGNHFYYVKAQVDAALRRNDIAPRLREYLKSL